MNFDLVQLWLTQHPDWILGCIFAVSFFESLAMVGILSPGIALLFVAGTAAGGTHIDYWQVILAAYAGAVLGDVLSYFLGAHFHKHMVAIPPFKQHPEWIDKAEQFFNRYGLYGLFVGRFIGPLRPVLPMIAGALELPFLRFLMLDLFSGPLWAAVYLTPGFLVGSAAGAPAGEVKQLAFFCAGLIGIGVVVAELMWRFLSRERTPRQATAASLTVLSLSGLVMVLLYFTVLTQAANPLNHWLAIEITRVRQASADLFFVALTNMGDMKPMVIWGVAVAAALALQRAWWPASVWMIGTLTGNAFMQVMKSGIGIERPHLAHRVPNGYSFPSGHASMGLVFMGLITVLIWPRLSPRMQRLALHVTALYVVLMTGSRLYLGVHWTSDVLAGWALGAGVIAFCWLLLHNPPAALRESTARVHPWVVCGVTLLAWLALSATHIAPLLDQALRDYQTVLDHQTGRDYAPQLKAIASP